MKKNESTIDEQEVNKFAEHAKDWWDIQGPLKTLHHINNARLEFIRNQVNLKGIRVLDVGCGGGILSEAMAKAGAVVTGIDAEKDAIQVAQEHAIENQLSIDYQCTSIEAFQDKKFNVITCMEMLEHVQNPELVLAHCKRLLKPKGILFLSTINRTLKAYASVIIAAEYILNILPRQTHDFQKFIKPSELIGVGRTLNLHPIDMKGMNYNPILRRASLSLDLSMNYLLALQ
jgi:2-polyprenyl-6-hydroxyphenyl methylase/3-demethylubiquinone-9 3-methyltransferase